MKVNSGISEPFYYFLYEGMVWDEMAFARGNGDNSALYTCGWRVLSGPDEW